MLKELFEILNKFGAERVETLKRLHVEAGQKASGKALQSFDFKTAKLDTGVRLLIGGAKHSYFLEHGRGRGGFPPPDKIRQWIRDKGLAGQFDKEYKLNSFAYLIGKKIAEQGSKLSRTGKTETGHSGMISKAFDEETINQLSKQLTEILGIEIKSSVIKELKDVTI